MYVKFKLEMDCLKMKVINNTRSYKFEKIMGSLQSNIGQLILIVSSASRLNLYKLLQH